MKMHNQSLILWCLSVFFFFAAGNRAVQAGGRPLPAKKLLFVFGDSYADTGNANKTSPLSLSWKVPYGSSTYPRKPDGRHSNGRVLTDFVASFMKIKSPAAYQLRNHTPYGIKYGINFALGGVGVFKTVFISDSTIATQIDLFKNTTTSYSSKDLKNSVALFVYAGNDYITYFSGGGTYEGAPTFVKKVVDKLTTSLQQIHSLGLKKVAITAIEPLGCTPVYAASSPLSCNTTYNDVSKHHNKLVYQAVAKLNKESQIRHGCAPFVILDMYDSFSTIIQKKHQPYPGFPKFSNTLTPCCAAVNSSLNCGSVDNDGNKLYKVCSDPKSAFFWDTIHPTDEGWRAVYLTFIPKLEILNE